MIAPIHRAPAPKSTPPPIHLSLNIPAGGTPGLPQKPPAGIFRDR